MNWASRLVSRTAGTVATVALAGAGAIGATTVMATPALASGSVPHVTMHRFDQRLLFLINRARRIHGERPLLPAPGTTDVAHGWSCRLAQTRDLGHNLRLGSALDRHGSAAWTTYAENVGYVYHSQSADALFRAYMNSPEHRANILDRSMRYVGVWSKRGGNLRFNTIDFVGSTTSAYHASYGAQRRTHC